MNCIQMLNCESYKYYNELVEEYCEQYEIDMNLFFGNRKKNLQEREQKQKTNKERGRGKKKKRKSRGATNDVIEDFSRNQSNNDVIEDDGETNLSGDEEEDFLAPDEVKDENFVEDETDVQEEVQTDDGGESKSGNRFSSFY